MSLLDDEDVLADRIDRELKAHYRLEGLFAEMLFAKGQVVCAVADDGANLATMLQSILRGAFNPELKAHSARNVISLDCSLLTKGDAYGWLANLAKVGDDQIVVLYNVTQIPNDDSSMCDDPLYVTNLLLRSWKNEDIYIGDNHLNRKNMTIILTCREVDHEMMIKECGLNSYKWVGEFNEWIEELKRVSSYE